MLLPSNVPFDSRIPLSHPEDNTAMKRLQSSLKAASVAVLLSLAVGCTAQIGGGAGTGTAAPGAGAKGGGGSASGTPFASGSGNNTGTGAGAVVPGGTTGNPAGSSGSAGTITDPAGSSGGATLSPGDPNAAGPRPLRLLTAREYMNTTKDLLGDGSILASGLPDENDDPAAVSPFHTTGDVASLDATLYRDAAEALAKGAVTRMNTLLPCSGSATTANDMGCFNTFLSTLAVKMYRRPLSAADKTRFTDMYNTAKAAAPTGLGLAFPNAIGFVIETVLQSPEFLYHWEVDPVSAVTEGGMVKLGNYEMANRLSYFLWGTMPDQTLFDAAAAGQLSDVNGVTTQVRRMVADARTGLTFSNFFVDWLDVDTVVDRPKDPTTYPMYNDMLTGSMISEVQNFVSNIMVSGSGHFDDLMTGTSSYANQALAALYGVSGVTGTAMKPVMLNPAQRSGLLTMAGFMSLTGGAAGSDPPRRGKAILNKLLCRVLPPPPNVVPDPAPVMPGVTTRQRFEQHSQNPCATACHTMLDPLGFAFENYDGIGQYRTMDNNLPVNASVTLTLDGKSQTLADARALAAALAASDEAQSCFTTQWFRYALGRPEVDGDTASINTTATTFKTASRDVRELVVGVSTSRTFRYRAPGAQEVLQ